MSNYSPERQRTTLCHLKSCCLRLNTEQTTWRVNFGPRSSLTCSPTDPYWQGYKARCVDNATLEDAGEKFTDGSTDILNGHDWG